MQKNSHPVLVTGATGKQGGAAARALLARGTRVRALVRDLHSKGAETLQAHGAELVLGDYDDRASLRSACTGARAVFSVHSLNLKDLASDSERVQGKNLVEAARAAGVAHFVHTSVAGAGAHHRNAPGWKEGKWKKNEHYWESKAYIDDLVRNAGFESWTVIKPAFFMENFVRPSFLFANFVDDEHWLTVIAPDTVLSLVAVQDIGAACAAAIENPEKFDEVDLELAGDRRSLREVVVILSEVWGKKIEVPSLSPAEALAQGLIPELVSSQEWINAVDYPARPAQAHDLGLTTTDFETWAREKWPAGQRSP